MDSSDEAKKRIDLLDYDWEKLTDLMQQYNPKEDVWYMITLNKGQDNE